MSKNLKQKKLSPQNDTPHAGQDRIAFFFGALLVYLIGVTARVTAFHSLWRGVQCTLIVDTTALLLVLVNRHLLHAVQKHLRNGYAMASYILTSAALSAGVIILFTRFLGTILPLLASPWTRLPNAQFVYFTYLFSAWAVAGRWLDERARYNNERIDALAAHNTMVQSEMQRLRLQLSPHFLFNTLNMLAVEIPEHSRRALLVLRELNHYLRYTLDNAERSLLPATQEIAGLRSFVRLQQMRYGESLKLTIKVEGSPQGHCMPTFLLQPIVENAIKHSMISANGTIDVHIHIVAKPGIVSVQVSNCGDLETPSELPGTGTGLRNIGRRLALHYPERHNFLLEQQGELVVAQLMLRGEPC